MGETPRGFGPRLRHAREVRGLSQHALAQQSEVSIHSISRYESGHRTNPDFRSVRDLARALQVPLSYLGEEDWLVVDL